MPLFSVVIPTHNRAATLIDAVNSVFAQDFTDFEVIVVDDASTDNIAQVVSDYGGRIRFVRRAVNGGPGAARNTGVQNASGDYVAFLDSDDLWLPWTLETFAELVTQYSRPAILSSSLVEFNDDADLAAIKRGQVCTEVFADYYSSHCRDYFVGAGMAVLRRDRFLEVGGFAHHRMNAEDHDLILRMGTMSGFVQLVHPVTLGWRRHSGSCTNNVSRTVDGMRYLLQQEIGERYPGGRLRAYQRRQILTKHIRSAALECLAHGLRQEAWQLYGATFGWHLRLHRWKFLVGLPLRVVATATR